MAGTEGIMHGTLYSAANGQLSGTTAPGASSTNTTNSLNHSSLNGVMPLNSMAMSNACQYESSKLDMQENKEWFGATGGGVVEHLDQAQTETQIKEEVQEVDDNAPVIDIMINNVVCSFSVACHIDLQHVARFGHNVEFRKENGMVTMKLRKPLTTASIWSSGKITCTGSTSELQARVAARRIARRIQKLNYPAKFRNFRIVNVLGTCTMPFSIKITQFSQKFREAASYEPELHPGVTYKIDYPKATLKIFSTGSITVTAPSVSNVQNAIEHIYPLVQEFSKVRTPEEMEEFRRNRARRSGEIIDSDTDFSLSEEEYEDL
ncbi:TATA box-binding protein-like 1 [Penaeus monodon]|uniref:TATA box-binding protein-like 1 n=1 Tax=Penaeus monodon TaxID=6687 RepID=UPI0018A788F3|nr:TATA box-binding protein-like 1 [Penaeus monodon]